MAKWVTKELEKLLKQINSVPMSDSREGIQLSLLMKGFAELNNKAMDKAATKTKEQLRNWKLDEESDEAQDDNITQADSSKPKEIDIRKGSIEEKIANSKKKPKSAVSDALTKLRPVR
jgi:hypothetical protein